MRKLLLFAVVILGMASAQAQTVTNKKHGTFDIEQIEEWSVVELYGKWIQVDGEDVSKLTKKSVLTDGADVYRKKEIKRAKFIKMMIKNGWEVIGTRNETRSFYNPAIKSQQTVSFPVTTFAKSK